MIFLLLITSESEAYGITSNQKQMEILFSDETQEQKIFLTLSASTCSCPTFSFQLCATFFFVAVLFVDQHGSSRTSALRFAFVPLVHSVARTRQ